MNLCLVGFTGGATSEHKHGSTAEVTVTSEVEQATDEIEEGRGGGGVISDVRKVARRILRAFTRLDSTLSGLTTIVAGTGDKECKQSARRFTSA